MKQKEIEQDYKKFNIPKEKIPVYENPYPFASHFKRCSVLEYENIFYSNTSDTAYSKK